MSTLLFSSTTSSGSFPLPLPLATDMGSVSASPTGFSRPTPDLR